MACCKNLLNLACLQLKPRRLLLPRASFQTGCQPGIGLVKTARHLSCIVTPGNRSADKYASLEVRLQQQPCSLGVVHSLALRICGFYSKESIHRRAADRLYASATAQSTNKTFLDALSVERSFRGDFGIIALHVWMLLRRMREEGIAGKELSQTMYDVFQDDIEQRVYAEGVTVQAGKLLPALEQSFYGSAAAYDKSLENSSRGLAEALHRNVFFDEGDSEKAKVLAEHVRHELGCLSVTATDALLEGRMRFSNVEVLYRKNRTK